MDNRNLALSLLFLSVIVSGCADNGGKVAGQAITVTGPDVEPSEIFEGSTTRISMSVENTGEVESRVELGQNGKKVLTDYCPDFFTVQSFDSRSTRNPDSDRTSYSLNPGERLQMNWELKQEGTNVPLSGYSCPMSFQVPFDYSVETYRQLQVKKADTETNVPLSSKTSKGPLSIVIETIGSSSTEGAPVFLEGDKPEALIQVRNEKPEESVFRGVIRIEDLELSASQVDLECGDYDEPITLNRNQESQIVRCGISVPEDALDDQPSIRAEITASADYTYVKNIGTRNVEVKYSGN